ncbi:MULTISPECIES: FAD:protein FMN transferase [unclassified Halobacteriovorax]|uniref:FAD:protein FMN transferase n=1 Tax=unclassified Halobacteriovorax TaxID=2639665 RepID=UPI00399A8EE7
MIHNENQLTCEYRFSAMGGEFQLLCFPQSFLSREDVLKIFHKAEKEVLRIQSKFSDFEESPFNEINKYAGIRPVKVDDEIWNIIKIANRISRESNGVFDISFATIGHLWREAKENGRTLSLLERTQMKAFIDYRNIQMNYFSKCIFLPFKQMRIGLGGIGKGYAIDMVYELLLKEGISNFYINGSGDIRVHSLPSAPRAWRIGIKNPFSADSSKSIGVLQVSTGSIASSGGYIHFNPYSEGMSDHHIVNPRSGFSNDEIIACTVIAEHTVEADTTATILMNLDVIEAIRYLDNKKLIGFVIDRNGKTHLSVRALSSFGL